MGKNVGLLTGDLLKDERQNRVIRFQKGEYKVLVTTNLLARGYDEKKVSLVVNLDLPIKQCANLEDAEVDVAN